jgi:DNA-binding IclR family transcriptional regulator
MLPDRQQSRAGFRPIGSVVHACQILEAIAAAGGPLGVNELARRVGLDPSSVSRLVRTMEHHRLLERETATNRVNLGMGLVLLASGVLHGLDVRSAAGFELDRLSRETRETINLGVWDLDSALIVDHRAGLEPIAALGWVGRRDPAHATSLGKALLAFQPEPVVRAIVDGSPKRFTPTTITGRTALTAALDEIRRRGYAVNRGEMRAELHAVAAPVFGLGDVVVAAIGIAGPASRFAEPRIEELADAVRDAALIVSRALGASPAATVPGVRAS